MVETDGGGRPHPTPAATAGACVVGAVLIGGGSRRMGRDKAELVVDGQRLVARAVRSLSAAMETTAVPVLVVGPHPEARPARPVPPQPADARWITDLRVDAGPLAGVEAALAAASSPAPGGAAATAPAPGIMLLAGVDHPWVVPEVLSRLAHRLATAPPATAAVVLGTADGPQLLLGAYRTTALATVRRLLDGGERRLRCLQDHLDIEVLPPEQWRDLDPLGTTAVDVDDPEALAAATRWHARAVATTAQGRDSRASGADGSDDRSRVVHCVHADGSTTRTTEVLVGEAPLVVSAAGPGQETVSLATLLRTPGNDVDLALGWSLARGVAGPRELLAARTELTGPATRSPTGVTIRLERPVAPDTGMLVRAPITDRIAPIEDDPFSHWPLPWAQLAWLPEELRLAQGAPRTAGGRHVAGLSDAGGRLVTVREDLARHNALDAVIGAHLRGGVWPDDGLTDLVCVLSCRVGVALVATAAAARIPVIAAVGTASDLAVGVAEALGITLVGALHDGSGSVYTHPHRLALPR